MLGLLVFVLIFAIIVPAILYKLKLLKILAVYFPNLDIIATILSYDAGFKDTLFSNLYNTQCKFNTEKHKVYSVSEIIINYLSLMGLFFVVFLLSKNDVYKGLSYASIMLLMTYMLPNQIIEVVLNYIHDAYKLNVVHVVLVGMVIMGLIIGVEHLILENFLDILRRFFKMIVEDVPRKINKM